MVTIEVKTKLLFIKAIMDTCNVGLSRAKQICDEIFPPSTVSSTATFNPKKFGWSLDTLEDIVSVTYNIGGSARILDSTQ